MLIGKENLKDWAVARAFFLPVSECCQVNLQTASCVVCGLKMKKGEGQHVSLRGTQYPVSGTGFVCKEDADYIRQCQVKYPS